MTEIREDGIVEAEGRYAEIYFPYDDVTIIKGKHRQQILDGQKALEELPKLKLDYMELRNEKANKVMKYIQLEQENQKLKAEKKCSDCGAINLYFRFKCWRCYERLIKRIEEKMIS